MNDSKLPNNQFLEDLKIDIQNIYNYFIHNPTIEHLESTYVEFSLDCIANPIHPQAEEFINAFFISIICCIYQSVLKDDFLLFVLLIYIMNTIYFNQTKTNVRISINFERLQTINEFILYAEVAHAKSDKSKELLTFCVACLDSLKVYCGFDVYVDKDSFCLPENDSIMIIKEISKFEDKLSELEDVFDKLISKK